MKKNLITIKEDAKNKVVYIQYKHNVNKYALQKEYTPIYTKYKKLGWCIKDKEII